MSLLTKVLKLAQDLDNKGLSAEADTLDKFAISLPSPESLDEDEFDRLDPETYMEVFRELFLHNNTEAGMEPAAAASAAVMSVNKL
jgi:hypothetical protein